MKKKMKTITNMIGTGVALGVGANVVSSVGGDASAIANLSKVQPLVGSITGAGWALDALKGMQPKRKRKR